MLEGMAVPQKPESSIHFAVRSCLARCRLSDAPLTSLREFANDLEATGWDRESIAAVEREVLRCLRPDTIGRHSVVVTPNWLPDSQEAEGGRE